MEGRNYLANHKGAPQSFQGTPSYQIEMSEGNNPPGDFYAASYLPVVQSENRIGADWFVMMSGKIAAYDTTKRLIPVGLAWDKDNFDAAYAADLALGAGHNASTAMTAGATASAIKYSNNDQIAGVLDAAGVSYAQAGDAVTEGMKTAGRGVTDPVGIVRYNVLRATSTDPYDPTTNYVHAYDQNHATAYTRWAYVQVPIVEVNEREELMIAGQNSHRIALYIDGVGEGYAKSGNAPKIYVNGVLNGTIQQVAVPNNLVQVTGAPTQFALIGRTLLFNSDVPANWSVRYQPKVDLPFTCLKAHYGAGVIGNGGLSELKLADYIGQEVGYNIDSNFQVYGTSGVRSGFKIGRILDLKVGSSKDLALVRTHFRDFGLWQEGPGSATDGRNAYLSIANAPKYIARIAVNFNLFY